MNKSILISKIILSAFGFILPAMLTNCSLRTANTSDEGNLRGEKTGGISVTEAKQDYNANQNSLAQLSKIPTVSYCELVKNPGVYDRAIVRLRAIYFTGFEKIYLYDSRCEKDSAPEAPENVPAEMWAERDKSLTTDGDSDQAKLNRRLSGFGRKDVTVIGRFYSTNEQNDKNAPNLFGHMNCCRFQFRIMRVESISEMNGKTAERVNDSKIVGEKADGANYQLEAGTFSKSGKLSEDELIVRKIKLKI